MSDTASGEDDTEPTARSRAQRPPAHRRTPGRVVALVVALAVAVPVLGLVALRSLVVGPPVTTTVETVDGGTVELRWAEHPGLAGQTVDAVLEGPTLAAGVSDGTALTAELRAALSARFDLEWVDAPVDGADDPTFEIDNGWGGPSMLRGVNLPGSQSTSVPVSWPEKQEALAVIGEVTTRHGWSEPYLDEERWPQPRRDRIETTGGATLADQVLVTGGVEGPSGQWLFFSFQDLSKDDADGTFADRLSSATEAGWQEDSIVVQYGANGLLPDGDRAEFTRRAAPFVGHPAPEPRLD